MPWMGILLDDNDYSRTSDAESLDWGAVFSVSTLVAVVLGIAAVAWTARALERREIPWTSFGGMCIVWGAYSVTFGVVAILFV